MVTIKPEHYGALKVKHVIFHDVPRHKQPPTLAEIPTAVSVSHIEHLRKKLTVALRSSTAYPVRFDLVTTSPLPEGVRAYTTNPKLDSFVPLSQTLAQHLSTYHTGGVSAGLLCIIDIEIAECAGVAMMKLEREEGARLELSQDAAGKKTYEMSMLNNLVMTDGTRLYKSAMFARIGEGEDDFYAVCCDDQSRVTSSGDMAKFWLKFLGCGVIEEPRVATERFYEASVRFINDAIEDPIQKNDLYEHLYSQLKSNKKQFVPTSFITEYVPDGLQKPFREYLKSQGAPLVAFIKDVVDINSRIKRHSYKTKEGAILSVPSDKVAELVEVKPNRIVVKDEIASINHK